MRVGIALEVLGGHVEVSLVPGQFAQLPQEDGLRRIDRQDRLVLFHRLRCAVPQLIECCDDQPPVDVVREQVHPHLSDGQRLLGFLFEIVILELDRVSHPLGQLVAVLHGAFDGPRRVCAIVAEQSYGVMQQVRVCIRRVYDEGRPHGSCGARPISIERDRLIRFGEQLERFE